VGSGLPPYNFNQYKTVFEKGNREGDLFLNLLVTADYRARGEKREASGRNSFILEIHSKNTWK